MGTEGTTEGSMELGTLVPAFWSLASVARPKCVFLGGGYLRWYTAQPGIDIIRDILGAKGAHALMCAAFHLVTAGRRLLLITKREGGA
jgi:hypothetical protein